MDKIQLIQIIKETPFIVGILSTSQQVKYGKTNNGKPIYQIKPIKNILPPFWITYGGKLQGKILINFKFKNWPDDSKLPFGEIVDVLGYADDTNLTKALIYHYQVQRKNFKNINDENKNNNAVFPIDSKEADINDLSKKLSQKINIKNNSTEKKEDEYTNKEEECIIRKDLTHLNVFSIDPKGCIDIDDALSLEKVNDKTIIGVHIAQPICWLTKEDIIERSKTAFSTLYLQDNNISLWSDEITIKASLLEGIKKPAFSILFTIENNRITDIDGFPSIIINKLNTSYEEIYSCDNIIECKEVTEKILNKEIDSHELVSFWMIKANLYIGNNFDNIPYRVQDFNNKNIVDNLDEIKDDRIKKIFNNMNLEGAFYSYDITNHYSLDLTNYTHFTSPIRRIIDTIIHWSIIYDDKILINLENINKLDYKTKKFHRQMNLLDKIKNLPDELETFGYLYKKDDNKFIVYFDEIGFSKVKLWSNKFDYLEKKDINIDDYQIGNKYKFKISKKPGFLPSQKILITLKPNNI